MGDMRIIVAGVVIAFTGLVANEFAFIALGLVIIIATVVAELW